MSASFTISPREVKELSATRTTKPSRLRDLAQTAEMWASYIERHWSDLEEEQRRVLAAYSYAIIEAPKGLSGRLRSLRAAFRFGYIRLREGQDALFDLGIAQRRLINAILDAVERDNPEYQKAHAEAVENALSEIREGNTATLTDEDTGDWLRQLSDEALK